jgi:RNA polymerase sigma factor (sigma-70 family)
VYVSKLDEALVAAAQGGDSAAITSLLAAAQPDIRRYASRSCHSADDIDDVVQDTLVIVFRRIGTLRALGSLSAWLLSVVRRECLRMAPKLTRRPHAAFDEAAPAPLAAARLRDMSQEELRLDLARAIQSLPEYYRQVVLLRDVEYMTIDEIAAARLLSRESVKARLRRARLLLREYLMA